MDTLFGFSIRQPWIDMIVRGAKTIEFRSWQAKRRGRIALHAAQRVDFGPAYFYGYRRPWELARGKIVALAEISEVVQVDSDLWWQLLEKHRQPLPFVDGLFAIVLRDVKPLLRPISCRGRQYFFPLGEDLTQKVWAAAQAGH